MAAKKPTTKPPAPAARGNRRSPAVERWLRQEIKEQKARYKKIAQAINIELDEQREQWFREFEQRIQTTGFNTHADLKRKIKPEEIYPRPKRRRPVVF